MTIERDLENAPPGDVSRERGSSGVLLISYPMNDSTITVTGSSIAASGKAQNASGTSQNINVYYHIYLGTDPGYPSPIRGYLSVPTSDYNGDWAATVSGVTSSPSPGTQNTLTIWAVLDNNSTYSKLSQTFHAVSG